MVGEDPASWEKGEGTLICCASPLSQIYPLVQSSGHLVNSELPSKFSLKIILQAVEAYGGKVER